MSKLQLMVYPSTPKLGPLQVSLWQLMTYQPSLTPGSHLWHPHLSHHRNGQVPI